MTASTGLPRGRPLTAADLETMPDDGHRYAFEPAEVGSYWAVDPKAPSINAWHLRRHDPGYVRLVPWTRADATASRRSPRT